MNIPRLAAPWYLHPAEHPDAWAQLRVGGRLSFVVVNAANGPGRQPDPYYEDALRRPSLTPLLGYVDVGYGDRSASVVRREAMAWAQWYGVTELMLDRVPSQARRNSWSLDVIDQLRADGASKVVANPGTVPVPELVAHADITCVVEDSWAVYQRLDLPRWLRNCDPARQWHLVHSCPVRCLQSVHRLAAARGAGFVWASRGTVPHPWGQVPEGW